MIAMPFAAPSPGMIDVSLIIAAYSGVTGIVAPSSSVCVEYSSAMNDWPLKPDTLPLGVYAADVIVGPISVGYDAARLSSQAPVCSTDTCRLRAI